MSYILQFFHAPQVDQVAAAVDYISGAGSDRIVPSAQFARFVERVSADFPDLSEEDEDGELEDNIWPEGLDPAWAREPVVNVAIKTDAVSVKVLCTIARHAIDAGLQMLDPQNAMLYRANGLVVDGAGATWATHNDKLLSVEPFVPPPPGTVFTPRDAVEGMMERLRDTLAARNVIFDLKMVGFRAMLVRQHGKVRQVLSLVPDPYISYLSLELWLSSERLPAVWRAALPEVTASQRELEDLYGADAYDFRFGGADLLEPATDDEFARFSKNFHMRTREEADDYTERLCCFVPDRLLPLLEPVLDLPSLANLALTEYAIGVVREGHVFLREQLATAVLARLGKPEVFDAVAQGLKHNPNRALYWKGLNDADGRLLDRLIDELRALPEGG